MLTATDIQGKNVLFRADLDIPLKDGRVDSAYRLEAMLPSLQFCLENARRTCIIGHLGRPEGPDREFSLIPVLEELKRLIKQDILFIDSGFSPGECWTGELPLALMENLRFHSGEQSLDREFAKQLVAGADIYVYDAFSTYRDSASLQIIPELLSTRTGFRFDTEVSTLSNVLIHPDHPTLLLASGAKLDKLEIIKKIEPKFDRVLFGGKFAEKQHLTPDGLDLNSEAISLFTLAISEAKTIVFNGPVGKYEEQGHSEATKAILQALKESQGQTIIGGGDTLAAITTLDFDYSDFSFVSTGGGAMLEFLANGTHPLLEILHKDSAATNII